MPEADLVLLKRFCDDRDDRDDRAFAQIVLRYSDRVFAACQRVLGDHARAQDVTQQTFFLLLRRPEAVKISLVGWLRRVATRLAIDMIRSDTIRLRREASYVRSHV